MPKKTAPEHVQTTYVQRFGQALGLLCTETPPTEMCEAWLFSDDERLQEWVLNRLRLPWPQGIGAIDAARTLADFPEEGHYDTEARTPLHLTFEDDQKAYRQKHGMPPLPTEEVGH